MLEDSAKEHRGESNPSKMMNELSPYKVSARPLDFTHGVALLNSIRDPFMIFLGTLNELGASYNLKS